MKYRTLWLFLAVLTALTGCSDSPDITDLSDDLIGIWRTSYPKYADRYFTLEKTVVSFATGAGDSTYTIHPISSVEGQEEPEVGRVLYTVNYSVEGEQHQFFFYHYPANQTIRFKNQSDFEWTRDQSE